MDEHTQHTNGNGKSSDRETPETMFDSLKIAAGDLAERAAPTVRELSARAAELTATAANKAAPFARKAGAATADASLKLAESARGWAADLRTKEADASDRRRYGDRRGRGLDRGRTAAPSDLSADVPPDAPDPAPSESTAEDESAGPAFEEDRSERRPAERRPPARLARHLTGGPAVRPGDARVYSPP